MLECSGPFVVLRFNIMYVNRLEINRLVRASSQEPEGI